MKLRLILKIIRLIHEQGLRDDDEHSMNR